MNRNKILLISLAVAFVLTGYGISRRISEVSADSIQREEPTSIKEGQMTEEQKEHSKLYKKYSSRQKIYDRLKSETGVIDIYKLSPLGAALEGSPIPTPQETIRSITCSTDAVIVGTVNSKSSQITEDQSFLFTDYEMSVKEILKNNNSAPLFLNSKITVTRPGGAVLLNGRTIRALDQSFRPLKKGEQYLLFLQYLPKTGTYRSTETGESFHLKDNKIKAFREGSPSWLEASFTPLSLMTEVRVAATAGCDKNEGFK